MIDVIQKTPEEYSKQSRDYQLISRLYTALFNMNKLYSDNLNVWNSNIDNKLTTLRSKTLNFDPKHSWNLDALEGAVSSFKHLMSVKGTKTAIIYCVTILMRINGLYGAFDEPIIKDNNIIIRIPTHLASIGVLKDLFDYIVPAGMTYRIIEYRSLDVEGSTLIGLSDEARLVNEIYSRQMGIYNGNTEDQNHQGYSLYHNIVSTPVEWVDPELEV